MARDWLRRVVQESGQSLSMLAAGAGVARSTLYRAAADEPDQQHVLSTVTIAKISRFTGIAPPAGFDDGAPLRGLSQPEAEPFDPAKADPKVAAVVASLIAGGGVAAWVLRTHALELRGYLPGDILFLDLAMAPKAGDVVSAEVYSFDRGRADRVWRLHDPPYLLSASSDPGLMRPFRDDQAAIKGVVVGSWRPRGSVSRETL